MSPARCDFWLVFMTAFVPSSVSPSDFPRLLAPPSTLMLGELSGAKGPLDFRGELAWRGRWKLRMEGNNEGHH